MITNISDCLLIDIPKIQNNLGNLSVVEGETIPFAIGRVYYLYDVPSTAERYGHAHKTQKKFLVALSGSFEILVKDGKEEKVFTLNKPNIGLYIPDGIWRKMQNFSSGSVCLVIASDVFDESDYVRNFKNFRSFKNRIS